jgi:PKHD-type hydroxylase
MNILRINKELHPVYWIHNFLSDDEIEKIITYTKDLPTEDAKVGYNVQEEEKKPFTLDYHIKNPNIGNVPRTRITNIKWVDSNPNTNWLYKKIINQIHKVNQENFDMILKFVENLQFSEYTESQQGFYGKHNDCGDSSRLESFVDIRKLSFSIQLTDEKEYEGGELIFYKDGEEKIAPKSKGTIIFFESDIMHEVKPVKKGTRHALVSWVQGPNLR